MKKILCFFIICISSFGFWHTSENLDKFSGAEKEIGLFNFNGDSSWISIDKVEEFLPVYSENGKQVFSKPQKTYYDISVGFEEFLANRSINNLKIIKITNDKNEIIKEFKVKVLINDLFMKPSGEKEALSFIELLRNSKELTFTFRDDTEKLVVQKFNTEGFNDSEKLMISRKETVNTSSNIKETENLTEEQKYINDFMKVDYVNFIKSDNTTKIFFRVKNNGNKSVHEVVISIKYKDNKGNIIYENEFYPIYKGGLWEELKAYSVYKLRKNDYFYDENIPKEWSGNYEIKVKSIKFE